MDQGLGQRVGGQLVERRGQPHELLTSRPVEDDDVGDLGSPERERARLVEEHRAGLAEPLDDTTALDDHACLRGA